MTSNDLKEMNLEVARKAVLSCFFDKGVNVTSYEDIAERSGLATRTIRRYFKNKKEMVIDAVEHEGFEVLKNVVRQFYESIDPSLNGLDSVAQYFYNALHVCQTQLQTLISILEVNLFMRENNLKNENVERYENEIRLSRNHLKDYFSKGIADGSIREDVKPEETAFLLINLFFGMLQRMEADRYVYPKLTEEKIVMTAENFIETTVRLFKKTV